MLSNNKTVFLLVIGGGLNITFTSKGESVVLLTASCPSTILSSVSLKLAKHGGCKRKPMGS